MRLYGTQTIPASIKQKNEIGTKYGKPSRQLTPEDFEIVPEHEEEQLVAVHCEVCGVEADYFEPDLDDQGESSLISLQMYQCKDDAPTFEDVTRAFIKEYWYEVCETCMRDTVVPALKGLQRFSAPDSAAVQADEEPVLSEGPTNPLHPDGILEGLLIREEEGQEQRKFPPLAPLEEHEPF